MNLQQIYSICNRIKYLVIIDIQYYIVYWHILVKSGSKGVSAKYLDYEVTVVTGKEIYAGTDARVYLCLINENQRKSSEVSMRRGEVR